MTFNHVIINASTIAVACGSSTVLYIDPKMYIYQSVNGPMHESHFANASVNASSKCPLFADNIEADGSRDIEESVA